MLARELPPDTDLQTVKIRVPEIYRAVVEAAGLKTMEVYLFATWFSGIWVKPDRYETRTYPLQLPSENVLDWEVCG